MGILWSLLLGAGTLLSLVNGYADPLACSGTCTNAHDPSIIRRSSDGTYFRFSTGGKIAVHTASTLLGPWTYKGAALPSGSSINLAGNTDLWVHHYEPVLHELADICSGTRCLQSRRHVLPVLRGIHLRQPELCHWRRDVHHYGCRNVDRPRFGWCNEQFRQNVQCYRSQPGPCWFNVPPHLRLLLGRHLPSRHEEPTARYRGLC